jgi:ubiquinone/menaquinone biosynthesis C-methylase UbiE
MSSLSFDRAVSYYDATRGFPPGVAERVAEAIISAGDLTPTSRVLEMGIGTGRIALPLLMRGIPMAGIDLSEAMMARLQAKLDDYNAAHPEAPLPATQLVVGDSTALPFADASFDTVLSVHLLHLIPNWRQAVDESVRVLAPGGVWLRGTEESTQQGTHHSVQRMWFAIMQGLNYDMGQMAMSGYTLPGEVAAYLVSLGYTPETIPAVSFEMPETPREALEFIAQKLWSRTWVVPDDIFATSITQLRQEVAEHFGDRIDAPETRVTQFTLLRVRKGM